MPFDLTGPYPTDLHSSPTVPALLDIDAPVVDRNGLTLAPSGDYKLTSELATVEKILWAQLLTEEGSVDWDPNFGSRLRLKRLRPVDLSAERRRIAQKALGTHRSIRSVDVQLLFDGDEAMVAIHAETDFGVLDTSRPGGL